MASSSGAYGSGRTPGPPKSLAQQFFDHRLLSRSNVLSHRNNDEPELLPTPLDMKRYWDNNPRRQTDLCTEMACHFYNNHPDNKGKGIPKLRPERVEDARSNMFILDNLDPICYFHLYFKRKIKKQKHYYFAELEGKGGPERVTICREINKQTASAINCEHCFGGVLHPPEGFLGQRQARIIGYRVE